MESTKNNICIYRALDCYRSSIAYNITIRDFQYLSSNINGEKLFEMAIPLHVSSNLVLEHLKPFLKTNVPILTLVDVIVNYISNYEKVENKKDLWYKYVEYFLDGKTYEEQVSKLIIDEIKSIFPEYNEALEFDSSKKFFKLMPMCSHNYMVWYINDDIKSSKIYDKANMQYNPGCILNSENNFGNYLCLKFNSDIIKKCTLVHEKSDTNDYFFHLLNNKIIQPYTVYDIESASFIESITEGKVKLTVTNMIGQNKYLNNIDEQQPFTDMCAKISRLLTTNAVINGKIHISISHI